MGAREGIVAIAFLRQRDLDVLGSGFRDAYPVDELPMFADLLAAIDQAGTQPITSNTRGSEYAPREVR